MPLRTKQTRVVLALGSAQTLAWGSTYYLPAILATLVRLRDEGRVRAIGVATELAARGECVPVEDLDAFVDGMVARMEAAEEVLRKTGRG